MVSVDVKHHVYLLTEMLRERERETETERQTERDRDRDRVQTSYIKSYYHSPKQITLTYSADQMASCFSVQVAVASGHNLS